MGEPTFDRVCLEDSYFLGMIADGTRLRLRVLFALLPSHPFYARPLPNEAYCYREGDITFESPHIAELHAAQVGLTKHRITADPDGTLDLGSIEVVTEGDHYRVITEWFDLRLSAESVSVTMEAGIDSD
jgi:hypothetical protein